MSLPIQLRFRSDVVRNEGVVFFFRIVSFFAKISFEVFLILPMKINIKPLTYRYFFDQLADNETDYQPICLFSPTLNPKGLS